MSSLLTYAQCCIQDMIRGLRHNYHSPLEDSQKKLYYRLIIASHTIEKGLALHTPRRLFGRVKIRQVIDQLRRYDGSMGEFPVSMARGALRAYVNHHREASIDDPFLGEIEQAIAESEQKLKCIETGGMMWIDRPPPGTSGNGIRRRFSCRHYDPVRIEDSRIRQVIEHAQRAPSQCNRQSTRIHCYRDADDIRQLLDLQGGSKGFSEHVPNLFVVASELTAWGGPGQRNQAYVDGSLYAMCLMLACVEEGLHCCPLNLAVTNTQEKKIAAAGRIPHDQRLIMMIAFGESSGKQLKAAASPRLSVQQVLQLHEVNEQGPNHDG